jgi:hypothetical protein
VTRRAGAGGFEQTLARVVEAERDLSLLTERVAHFRRIGSWIVEERFALALLRSRVGGRSVAAPAPLSKAGAAILRALASSARLASACQARAIFAKTHQRALVRDQLRAFYFEPRPLTLKLMPPERRDELARELAARSEIPAEFGAPAVLGHRLEGPHPYLCEEFVTGRHPDPLADAPQLVAFVVGALWEGYGAAGIAWRHCGESHDVKELVRSFEDLMAPAPWRPQWPERGALRDAMLRLEGEADRMVPWCRGHGDLSIANMLVSAGRIRLLDWERARPLPLAHELAKITLAVPGVWPVVRERLVQLGADSPPAEMVPPDAQAVLGTLERLVDLGVRFSGQPSIARESKREAARFARRRTPAVDHIVRLLFGQRA